MKLIDLHKKWHKKGRLGSGLCGIVPLHYRKHLSLFSPTLKEIKPGWSTIYWGERLKEPFGMYNEFRQTIVLLICAMNNEL